MSTFSKNLIAVILVAIATGCDSDHKKTLNDANIRSLQTAIGYKGVWADGFPENAERLKSELVRKGIIYSWPKDPWGYTYRCEILRVDAGRMIVRLSGTGETIEFEVAR